MCHIFPLVAVILSGSRQDLLPEDPPQAAPLAAPLAVPPAVPLACGTMKTELNGVTTCATCCKAGYAFTKPSMGLGLKPTTELQRLVEAISVAEWSHCACSEVPVIGPGGRTICPGPSTRNSFVIDVCKDTFSCSCSGACLLCKNLFKRSLRAYGSITTVVHTMKPNDPWMNGLSRV